MVKVEESGDYSFTPRMSTRYDDQNFDISSDGQKIGTFTQANATGGYQNWINGVPVRVHLTKGQHILRLTFNTNGENINWFAFHLLNN